MHVYPFHKDCFPQKLLDITKDKKTIFVIVKGDSNLGKTEGIKSMLNEIYGIEHVLFVRSKEDFKNYKKNFHKAILMDDFKFKKEFPTREDRIHIMDSNNPCTIDVKHGAINLASQLLKILTTNREFNEIIDLNDLAQTRRAKCIAITKPLYLQININITRQHGK